MTENVSGVPAGSGSLTEFVDLSRENARPARIENQIILYIDLFP
jgi:hypothetical protein